MLSGLSVPGWALNSLTRRINTGTAASIQAVPCWCEDGSASRRRSSARCSGRLRPRSAHRPVQDGVVEILRGALTRRGADRLVDGARREGCTFDERHLSLAVTPKSMHEHVGVLIEMEIGGRRWVSSDLVLVHARSL